MSWMQGEKRLDARGGRVECVGAKQRTKDVQELTSLALQYHFSYIEHIWRHLGHFHTRRDCFVPFPDTITPLSSAGQLPHCICSTYSSAVGADMHQFASVVHRSSVSIHQCTPAVLETPTNTTAAHFLASARCSRTVACQGPVSSAPYPYHALSTQEPCIWTGTLGSAKARSPPITAFIPLL